MNSRQHKIISCKGIHRSFHDGNQKVKVLKGIDLDVYQSEFIAITGPSGSGKTTLLQILAGLDEATKGQLFVSGVEFSELKESRRCQLRNQLLGFVYQQHHLLPEFTAIENVAMPLLVAKCSASEANDRAEDLLSQVGLGSRLSHLPSQLSGGERQRVAIARALACAPDCILADEPTGNLDARSAQKVFEVLLQMQKEHHVALVVVTHDMQVANMAQRVVHMENGLLV